MPLTVLFFFQVPSNQPAENVWTILMPFIAAGVRRGGSSSMVRSAGGTYVSMTLKTDGTFSPDEASSSQASTKTNAWPEFEAGLPEFYGFDWKDMQQDPNMGQVLNTNPHDPSLTTYYGPGDAQWNRDMYAIKGSPKSEEKKRGTQCGRSLKRTYDLVSDEDDA